MAYHFMVCSLTSFPYYMVFYVPSCSRVTALSFYHLSGLLSRTFFISFFSFLGRPQPPQVTACLVYHFDHMVSRTFFMNFNVFPRTLSMPDSMRFPEASGAFLRPCSSFPYGRTESPAFRISARPYCGIPKAPPSPLYLRPL